MKKLYSLLETALLLLITIPFSVFGFIIGVSFRMTEGGFQLGYAVATQTYSSVYGNFYKNWKRNASKAQK